MNLLYLRPTFNPEIKFMKRLLPLLILSLFIGCSLSDDLNILNQGEEDILKYLEENDLEATKTSTGLYYVVHEQGDGELIGSNATVTVAYKGYFLNGIVFDKSGPDGITFNLNQVIPGWTEGIPYFNEGGKGMLLIPPSLGYGAAGTQKIPGGAVLVFDIEILKTNT